jgi:type II secretory pathway pseudopilin PulG
MKLINKKNKGFTHTNFTNKSLGGFTLIETIIAVFLFMLVLTAIVSISGRIILDTRSQNLNITAQYLLQDGMEYIRNNRDSALNSGATWSEYTTSGLCTATVGTTNVTSICPCITSTYGCTVDPLYEEVTTCPAGGCPPIVQMKTGTYDPLFFCTGLGIGCLNSTNTMVKTTSFVRTIKLNPPSGNPGEMYVDVTVSWRDVGGVTRSKTLKSTLFNW